MRGMLQSRDRLEIPFGVLFMLALVVGMALWDEMALYVVPGNSGGWTGSSVSGALCLVFVSLSRRRWPLLLCAAFLISVRLTFVFAQSVPPDGLGLTADCLGVCTSLSVIVFRTEIASLWRQVRGTFGERVSSTECAPAVAGTV